MSSAAGPTQRAGHFAIVGFATSGLHVPCSERMRAFLAWRNDRLATGATFGGAVALGRPGQVQPLPCDRGASRYPGAPAAIRRAVGSGVKNCPKPTRDSLARRWVASIRSASTCDSNASRVGVPAIVTTSLMTAILADSLF